MSIKNKIMDAAFLGLIFSIFTSLNSITYQLFGVSQIASPLILIFCFVILSQAKPSKRSFNHMGIFLLYGFFLVYHIMGFGIRLYLIEVVYRNFIISKLMNFATSMIIIVSVHQYLYKRLIKDNRETRVFNLFYIPIIISCFYALFQSITGVINIMGDDHGRVMGVFANPNALGMVANISIALTIYSSYKHERFTFLKFSILPLLLYISFLSMSRASIITSAVIVLLSVGWIGIKYFNSELSTKKKYFFIGGVPFLMFVYIALNFESLLNEYIGPGQSNRIMGMIELVFEGEYSKKNTGGRSELFQLGYKAILNRPIFGNGIGYFSYFPKELGATHGVHNTYLLVWGDAGIFSFIIFIIYICYIFIKSIFVESLSGMLAFMLILIWAMQNITNHNGLDDKMSNILITFATVYLILGINIKRDKRFGCIEKS